MLSFRLDDKVAVITGGGRSIGRACASALADAGAHVVVLSRTREEVEEVAAEIQGRGASAQAIVCDITNGDDVARTIAELEHIDVLLNNAGVNRVEPFLEVTPESLDLLWAVNVRALFTVSQAVARHMVDAERGGVILNVSSQLGHVAFRDRTVYTMTKHAVEGLTKAMALDLASHGIRVNAVAPTIIETPMTASLMMQPGFRDDMLARLPIGRLATVDDVAAAVVFLASPAASIMTGASLRIDGGWTAQ
jgi:NAD(P)-dependent dehydrogenase (short-subunit alcohol dehydrogenase family)